MKKTFMGARLRRLREERGLTQVALARALEISPSYLNQIEQNQRPLTVQVLLKISAALDVDVQRFSDDDEARLITDLREVLGSGALGAMLDEPVSLADIRELAAGMPAIGRALIALDRRCREAEERVDALATRLGEDRGAVVGAPPMPYEEVRDFFYARHNHVAELDDFAERLFDAWSLQPGDVAAGLAARLANVHGVRVVRDDAGFGEEGHEDGPLRAFDPVARVLSLSPLLEPGQQAFQMATQLAFLEAGEDIDRIAAEAPFRSDEARVLARIGLANYFAGALVLPYGRFLAAAEKLRYDIDRLGRRFGVGFETVCHRLSTLQRPDARGVPFFFVRVDRAGNISKRQSATDFHFSRVGGTCPLWNVLRSLRAAGPHPDPARRDARWPHLFVDRALRVAQPRRLRRAGKELRHRPGLRSAPRFAPGLRQGAQARRPRGADADRRRLQGVRTPLLSAAGLSAGGWRPGDRREPQPLRALCRGGTQRRAQGTGARIVELVCGRTPRAHLLFRLQKNRKGVSHVGPAPPGIPARPR